MNYVNYYCIPGLRYNLSFKTKRDPDKIIEIICTHLNQPVSLVIGKCRSQKLVIPRHAIIYFLNYFTTLNKSDIARKLNMDHTSVISVLGTSKKRSTFQNRIDTNQLISGGDQTIPELINTLKEKILFTT